MKICCNLLFFLLFHQMTLGQENKPALFSHLTTDNGLSESFVTCILKDKYGFMWFGTGDGLNKYDGYKFKVFRNKPDNSKTIPYNSIMCLFEDKAGELWIGTSGGVAKYNRNDDSFTSYGGGTVNSIFESSDGTLWAGTFQGLQIIDRKAQKIISARSSDNQFAGIEYFISCIYEDSRRNLWIGTANGLFIYNSKQRKIQNIEYSHNQNPDGKSWVISVIEDRFGIFWIGAENGLHAFSYKNDSLLTRRNDIKVPEIVSGRITSMMCLNKDGKLWIGKESGLILFDPNDGTATNFQKKVHDEQSLSHSSIRSLYLDDKEILWVGTFGGGLNKYDKNQFLFGKYQIYSSENPNLISNVVTSFEEDSSGNIWIGTDGGGLFLWETAINRFIPFYPKSKAHYFPSYTILTIKLSRNKKILWVGTYDYGLIELNIKTRSIRFFNTENKRLNDNFVTSILEDRDGKLWIGTNNEGVTVIDPSDGEIQNLKSQQNVHILNNNTVRALCEDAEGKIWIGTFGGVKIYDPSTKSLSDLTEGNSNVSNIIYSIFKDSKNNIWVGSMGGGLYLFDGRTKKLTAFSEAKGLASNIVNSIIEDAQGYLWISTSRGISRLDPRKYTFKNYTREDGLQSNEFVRNAGYITKAGRILLGSIDGFNSFYPESDRSNTNIPPVVITDFQLANKSLPAGMYNPQLRSSSNVSPLTLSYDQSVFSIEFAALNFTVPEKNQYAYMLEGFDKDWNHIGYEHKATYTNLDPGEYIFRVIASNNDGIWNKKGTSLKIIITPPFWKTRLAYILYLLTLAGILYYIYREIKAREKLKNEIIFQKLTTEKMEELNQMKLNFFTNISHELRTPLSLIIDPLRKIINEISDARARNLGNLAFKNATRLSNLINQLLDFRRFSGQLKLETQHINLIEVIKEICQTFEEKAREREIEFNLSFNTTFKDAWMDVDKLEKILSNLISNAFKFTPNGGKIQALVSGIEKNENRSLEILIKDTGPGVPQAYKQKIFDLFFQVEGTTRYDMESSGIGLSLTKELVLLHGGEISEIGKQGEGAVFVVKLPVQEYIPQLDKAESPGTEMEKEKTLINISEESRSNRVANNLPEAPIILVVEDNPELRKYIATEVLSKYHVEQAANGVEGFEKASAFIPDLIISDIMMPDGDGIELCGKLKADEKTSHIPVILLTAKQTDENKIEGYRTGADAYISKPFNSALLNTQVENLLESRKRLRVLFSKVQTRHSAEAEITDVDKEFLKKAEQAVLDNLSNTQFDVDSFAKKLKMNRHQLSRKLKAISNQTPHEYMIIVRFKKASDLLIAGDLNISEVSYQVGFSDPAHFTRAFTKVYGKSPRKYLSEMSNQSK
jgi:ligand-binding sensor domain-containing protein/signal transduction histidine kinase/DNA-binding response OmpR family regulator